MATTLKTNTEDRENDETVRQIQKNGRTQRKTLLRHRTRDIIKREIHTDKTIRQEDVSRRKAVKR